MTVIKKFDNAELLYESGLSYYIKYISPDGLRLLHITSGEACMIMMLQGALQYIVYRYAMAGVVGEQVKEVSTVKKYL